MVCFEFNNWLILTFDVPLNCELPYHIYPYVHEYKKDLSWAGIQKHPAGVILGFLLRAPGIATCVLICYLSYFVTVSLTSVYLCALLWQLCCLNWLFWLLCFCVCVCSCRQTGLASSAQRLRLNTWHSNSPRCQTPPTSLTWVMTLSTLNILKSDLSVIRVPPQSVPRHTLVTRSRWNVGASECLCVRVLVWLRQVNSACSPVALAGNKCGLRLGALLRLASVYDFFFFISRVCACMCVFIVIPRYE